MYKALLGTPMNIFYESLKFIKYDHKEIFDRSKFRFTIRGDYNL